MRRFPIPNRTPTPLPVVFTSPVALPFLEMTVSAQGSFDDADGIARTVKVTLTRMVEDVRSAADKAAHGERVSHLCDGCTLEIRGDHILNDAFELDPSRPELMFRSEAGLRAVASLLVAACAEAERRGILGGTSPVTVAGCR